MKYFIVAANNRSGRPVPIMDGSDEDITDNIKLYISRKKAVEVAEKHPLCISGGYKIVKWDLCE